MLSWYWRSFDELSKAELYELLALRQEVFTLEQKVNENDLDFLDFKAIHLLGKSDEKLVAYLRLFPVGHKYPDSVSFGRVLIAENFRGLGLAKKMMAETLLYLEKIKNTSPVCISAQSYLEKFYQSYGFETTGSVYDEAGIPHVKMIKQPGE